MHRKRVLLLSCVFLFMGLASFGALVWYTRYRLTEVGFRVLPALGTAPDFTMTDQTGRPFSRADLDGVVWVADFFFTDCPGPCPTMTKNMARIRDAAVLGDLHLVGFSVNPLVDTPEKLTTYARKFRADAATWHFLTAPEADVQAVVTAMKMGMPDEPLINHSTHFALVDRQGVIRGYYDGTDSADVDQLIKDLKQLRAD